MRQRQFSILATLCVLAACKPPPTDADMLREMPETAPTFASAPLPSPETEGALWAVSTRSDKRIIYGVPGEPVLLALECQDADETGGPAITVTRYSPADEGAGALLAFVGNDHIGRIAVDATELGEDIFWQGQLSALDDAWQPLAGPGELTSTVPGAGMVTLNPSPLPGLLIAACRAGISIEEAASAAAEETEEDASPAS
jgi:hypothetical protein